MSSLVAELREEGAIRALARRAREAWPGIEVPEDEFGAELAAHATGSSAPPERAAVEMWLALACARGHGKALRELEARAFPGARAALSRMGFSADAIDEALQSLREKLFVAQGGQPARILAAAAHGDLAGVIRVAAMRTALNLRRQDHRLALGDAPLLEELAAEGDPELDALKEQHRAAFKAAIEDALRGLSPRERTLLRMHLLHGLSIDTIGATYRVHRATAARWLSAIREKLDGEARRLLRERQGLTDREVESLARLVESRIQVSFQRVLLSGCA
ncbi:sigma factor-like helix-turn-helix DNA-binding protein [Polyangium sorediatum]|uniref:Sigma factor-like helix-turn-helix DNA-binding protein n=1 Tax=Polyangium sorediatum TaxID=889274 RepID=A0ABT6P401_9BACT|nr:sigma factor-like helix-turn-helix DNA-binding protein [Polyangium sorediatum]MDI1435328.1 sigma factor-like helix-turn-helix DNA-binding protein [Polyangium sorediatum]